MSTTPLQYRKRPVVVEAVRVPTFDAFEEGVTTQVRAIAEWCGGRLCKLPSQTLAILIDTLEGEMMAQQGDWVIKGVKGEFYPCKPDIFSSTYELADAHAVL